MQWKLRVTKVLAHSADVPDMGSSILPPGRLPIGQHLRLLASSRTVLDATARGLAAVVLVAMSFIAFRLFNGADNPFLAYAFAGGLLVYSMERPSLKELAAAGIIMVLLGMGYTANGGRYGDWFGSRFAAVLAFGGLASIALLGWRSCMRTEALRAMLTALLCPLLAVVANLCLVLLIPLQPMVFDPNLYRFDGILGPQWSFEVGIWFQNLPWLNHLAYTAYAALPLVEVATFVLFLRSPGRFPANPMVVFVVGGLGGCALYQICPAAGPLHVFPSTFPFFTPPLPAASTMPLGVIPRNAIPSLHAAWAFLLWWNIRSYSRFASLMAAVFVVITLLATLGLGEHYLIDLIVAVPFAGLVQSGVKRQWVPAGLSLVLILAWLVYLRSAPLIAPPSTKLAWVACAFTLLAPAFLALLSRLAKR